MHTTATLTQDLVILGVSPGDMLFVHSSFRSLGAVDSVKEYRALAEDLREQELQRALRALARGDDPQQIVAQLARGITNKLIHAPTAGLKQASIDGRQDLLANARRLLGLSEFGSGDKAKATAAAEEEPARPTENESGSTDRGDRTLQ